MRYFEVYLDKKLAGVGVVTETVEMPDKATETECEEACLECLEVMIENELDTGWHEFKPSTARKHIRRTAQAKAVVAETAIQQARATSQEPK